MAEWEPERSGGEVAPPPADDAAGSRSHPLHRYFKMPPGGWPEQSPLRPQLEEPLQPLLPLQPLRPPRHRETPEPQPALQPQPQPPPPTPTPPPSPARRSGASVPLLEAAPLSPGRAATTRRRVRLGITSVALLLVAGGAIGGIVSTTNGSASSGGGVAAANFVVLSTQTTLSQHTADVAISGSISADGQTVPIHGTGSADFDTNSFEADVSVATASHSIVEHELVADDHVYFAVTVDGSNLSTVTGGPEWIDVPLPDQDSSSLGAGNVDPLDQLQLLEQRGATVVPLGISSVNGTTVSGYEVTFSAAQVQQEVQQEIQQEVQSQQLTQAEAQQAIAAAQALGPPTLHVNFDAGGLLREETVSTQGSVSQTTQVEFSNYGTPVNIEPPPGNDVISFTQFEHDEQVYNAASPE